MQVLDAKAQRSSRQHQSVGQKSSGNSNSNQENKNTSSNFIPWDALVMEVAVNATTVMKSEHIWGLDSHASVHIMPYRHRFIIYHQLGKPEHVVGWQGAIDTAIGVGSIELTN